MPDTRYLIPGAGYRMRDAGYMDISLIIVITSESEVIYQM